MGLLTREQVLSVPDLERETVKVPEWGGDVVIGGLSASRRRLLTVELEAEDIHEKATMAAAFIVDPVFTPDDVEALGGKNEKVIDRLITVGLRLSAIDVEAVEELEKNSDATIDEGSSSS